MKKIIRLVVLCTLLLSGTLFSQGLTQLYRDLINPTVTNDRVKELEINDRIELIGKIDPTIIYYYILSINHYEANNPEQENERFYYFKLYKAWENNFFERNVKWIAQEEDYAYSKYFNILASDITDYFNNPNKSSGAVFIEQDTLHPNDTTAYINYLWETREYESFNKSKNYIQKLAEVKAKKKLKIHEYFEAETSDREAALAYALQNQNLFRDADLTPDNSESNIKLSDYINKFIHYEYLQKNIFWLGFIASLQAGEFGKEFDFRYQDFRYPYFSEQKVFSAKQSPLLGGALGYRLKIREDKVMFSYVNFGAGFFFHSTQSTKNMEKLNSGKIIVSDGTRSFNGEYLVTKENETFLSFNFNLETPIYYVSKNFYLTAGGDISINSLKFDMHIERSYIELTSESPADNDETTQQISYEYAKTKITPFIGLRIDTLDPVCFYFRTFNLESVLVGINYNLGF